MAKYKTIIDNVNVYQNDEVIEVLKLGSTIEVEKIVSAIDPYRRKLEIAICKDGNEVVASFNGIRSLEEVKTKKKGDK